MMSSAPAAMRRTLRPALRGGRVSLPRRGLSSGSGALVEKQRAAYTSPPYAVSTVDLRFEIHEERTLVASTLRISPSGEGGGVDLVLAGEELRLLEVSVDGRALAADEYSTSADALTVRAAALRDGAGFELSTLCEPLLPERNQTLSGLYRSNGVYATQCEAEGFRRISYMLDQPDVMATYAVRLEADAAACPVLLSNGNKVGEGELEGGRHYAEWEDPAPKPSYLFAVVAGDLGSIHSDYTTSSGRAVTLGIYSEHENVGKLQHAMTSLVKSMLWDEWKYGLECDLGTYNIVAVNDFNMGAMENKGLNVFNTALTLADRHSATDADYERIESVIAHEYFHNWTGNRVTCRSWFELTLKEGLTVFRDQEFSADQSSRAVKRIANVKALRSRQFAEDSGPTAHPIRPESYVAIDNFYTSTVYEKGAEVIRMYHTLVGGDDGFRSGMDKYFERHDGSAVTCDDFRVAMADANGVEFGQFERWYTQAGTPALHARGRIEAGGEAHGGAAHYALTLTQSQPATPGQPAENKLPLHMPVVVGLLDALTGEEIVASTLLELTAQSKTFAFELPEKYVSGLGLVTPSILRGFSAPVKLTVEGETSEDLALLLTHDTDPFNSWEAGQKLLSGLILDEAASSGVAAASERDDWKELERLRLKGGDLIVNFDSDKDDGAKHELEQEQEPEVEQMAVPAGVLRAIETLLLNDAGKDAAFIAQALALPDVATLIESWPQSAEAAVDPLAIGDARGALRRSICAAHGEVMRTLYESLVPEVAQEFSLEPREVERRALRGVLLWFLCAAKGEQEAAMAQVHYATAGCMTDKVQAAAALADFPSGCPERGQVLADFRSSAAGDALVLNKWFQIQALSGADDALQSVRRLREDPDFTITNPNRLRSLASAFAANVRAFHAEDGSGYALVADWVLEVDALNPQVAARLAGSLSTWRKFSDERQVQMREQLVRLSAAELSTDTKEVVTRSL